MSFHWLMGGSLSAKEYPGTKKCPFICVAVDFVIKYGTESSMRAAAWPVWEDETFL